jgi:hypothetical protein
VRKGGETERGGGEGTGGSTSHGAREGCSARRRLLGATRGKR